MFYSRKSLCLLSLSALICFAAAAQPLFTRWDQVPVTQSGKLLPKAWDGGMDNCQFSSIDIDLDGKKDLFVFDRTGHKILPYIFQGGADTVNYKYAPEYRNAFPPIADWALLLDYNGDGKEDLFTSANGAFSVYKNTSSAGKLSFALVRERVQSDYKPGINEIYVSIVDIPAFADVDRDGDIDLVTFEFGYNTPYYHKNLSRELYGHADSIVFELAASCWGKFEESAVSSSVNLNINCSDYIPPSPDRMQKTNAHAGSSLLLLDMDSDRDMDLIMGDVGDSGLIMLTNGLDTNRCIMVSMDSAFPAYDTPVNLTIFPAPFYVDVDHDGKKDLLVGSASQYTSHNFKSNWYYKNTGADNAPVFAFQMDNLFQGEMIEVGQGARPVFFDYNADGLKDLFVGNYGYFQHSGIFAGKLALFQNTGTSASPAFTLVTDDYMNLSLLGIHDMHPAFGDMDGDGDMDMMLGEESGMMHYYENSAGAGNPVNFSLKEPNYKGIDVGSQSAPFPADMNRDGKMDLVVGERNGNLNYFINTGSASTPQFTLQVDHIDWKPGADPLVSRYYFEGNPDLSLYRTGLKITIKDAAKSLNNGTFIVTAMDDAANFIDIQLNFALDDTYDENPTPAWVYIHDDFFGDVDVRIPGYTTGYSAPFIYEKGGQYKLMSGSEEGSIRYYENIDGNLDGAFTLKDTMVSGIWEGERTVVSCADLNNDGWLDIAVGNFAGGLGLFQGSDPVQSDGLHREYIQSNLKLFPNPAGDHAYLEVSNDITGQQARIKVVNALGQLQYVLTQIQLERLTVLPLSELPPGIYLIQITGENFRGTGRLVVMKE